MVPSPKNILIAVRAGEEADFSVLVIKTPNPDNPEKQQLALDV